MASFGLDFRATSAFVTDPTNCTFVLASDGTGIDVTRSGITFNLASQPYGSRDSVSTVDARIAGYLFVNAGDGGTWSVTIKGLTAGSWDVQLAMGIANDSQGTCSVTIHDGAAGGSTLFSISGNPASGHFIDASNTDRTSAAWPGSNVATTVTLTGTSITAVMVGNVARAYLAHISVTSSGGGGGRTFFMLPGLDGHSSAGPKQFNPTLYHRHPAISLEAYRRERARTHREFLAKVRAA